MFDYLLLNNMQKNFPFAKFYSKVIYQFIAEFFSLSVFIMFSSFVRQLTNVILNTQTDSCIIYRWSTNNKFPKVLFSKLKICCHLFLVSTILDLFLTSMLETCSKINAQSLLVMLKISQFVFNLLFVHLPWS